MISSLELDNTDGIYNVLSSKTISQKIAYYLLNQMPFSKVISLSHWQKKRFTTRVEKDIPPPLNSIKQGIEQESKENDKKLLSEDEIKKEESKKKKDKVLPPRIYYIYHLKFSEDSPNWRPIYLGYTSPVKRRKNVYYWKIKHDGEPLLENGVIFASNQRGKSKDQLKLKKELTDLLLKYGIKEDEQNDLYDSFATGYVGIRHGHSILKKNDENNIISDSSTAGIFMDIRGGPFEGLRVMYDFAPEVTKVIGDKEAKFGWNRVSLGLSMGVEFDFWLSDRIDVLPKIGYTNFTANLPYKDKESNETFIAPFELNKKLSFGLELGIEKISPWFLIRTWGSADIAGLGSLEGSVFSLRGGLDTYWELFKIGSSAEVDLLVFALGETIKMTPSQKTSNISSSFRAKSLRFNLAFFGIGFTIAW